MGGTLYYLHARQFESTDDPFVDAHIVRIAAQSAGQLVEVPELDNQHVEPGRLLAVIEPSGPETQLAQAQAHVTANFKEIQLAAMRRGQPVTIEVDAYPDILFHGHVDSIQRGAGQALALLPPQNATGNDVKVVQRVPAGIEFDRRQGEPDPFRFPLGPGMSVLPTVKVR